MYRRLEDRCPLNEILEQLSVICFLKSSDFVFQSELGLLVPKILPDESVVDVSKFVPLHKLRSIQQTRLPLRRAHPVPATVYRSWVGMAPRG